MSTLFTRIITGELSSYKIVENELYLAFLDIRPLVKGHTLVIPKKEEDDIFELNDKTLSEMMIFAKKIAQAIRKVIPCKKVGIMAIGLEISHAHLHLVPINREKDLIFPTISSIKPNLMPDEMQKIATDIANACYQLDAGKGKEG